VKKIEDLRRLSTHLDEPFAVGLGRHKVPLRHLADGVANALVHRSFRNLTAMNVCDGNVGDEGKTIRLDLPVGQAEFRREVHAGGDD